MPTKRNPRPVSKKRPISKKKRVLSDVFKICKNRNDFIFDNDLVKKVSDKHKFKNMFDATKADKLSILPKEIVNQGYCLLHLGKEKGGKTKHMFVKAREHCFHNFEEPDEHVVWEYQPSLLNETDASESNILSVAFNQRIIYNFLYNGVPNDAEDLKTQPKMYNSRRTHAPFSYKVGGETIKTGQVQLEIDLTTEYRGIVTVFEAKGGSPRDFAVYQLFHPFLHYHNLKKSGKIAIEEINCCYLLRKKTTTGKSVLRLYLYTFTDPKDMSSIKLIKSKEYTLLQDK